MTLHKYYNKKSKQKKKIEAKETALENYKKGKT